jgi:Domain of unknown function (DUF4160)
VPVVFRWNGFRFHFFSDEGDPREPVHIHVVKDDVDAKFWLQPEVKVAYNKGFNAPTLAAEPADRGKAPGNRKSLG